MRWLGRRGEEEEKELGQKNENTEHSALLTRKEFFLEVFTLGVVTSDGMNERLNYLHLKGSSLEQYQRQTVFKGFFF